MNQKEKLKLQRQKIESGRHYKMNEKRKEGIRRSNEEVVKYEKAMLKSDREHRYILIGIAIILLLISISMLIQGFV